MKKRLFAMLCSMMLVLSFFYIPAKAASTKITNVKLTSDGILTWDKVIGAETYWYGDGFTSRCVDTEKLDIAAELASSLGEWKDESGKYPIQIQAYISESGTYIDTWNGFFIYDKEKGTFELYLPENVTVNFYTDNTKTTLYKSLDVPFKSKLDEEEVGVLETDECKGFYWCYIRSGEYGEEPFDFNSPIVKDMDVWGTWYELHQLTYVPEQPATETHDGNKEYYVCDKCGKIFLDYTYEYPATLADVTIPRLKTGIPENPENPDNPYTPGGPENPDNPYTPDGPEIFDPETDETGCFSEYQGYKFYIDDNKNVYCYEAATDKQVINDFKCDGTYTYFFQADGTAMRNRLTYHPDGIHVIYFDANGHEVFSDFANVKKTIAGDEVDDYCFFDVFGYMYVDVVTYDKTGTYLYYANAYGVLERGKWFQFSDYVVWADGREGSEFAGRYGCASADGTLIVNCDTVDWEGRACYLQGNGVALY